MEAKKHNSTLLLILTWIFAIAALSTLLPVSSASKTNLIGYKSLCTFTPVSTIVCLIASNAANTLRKRAKSAQDA